MAEGKTITRRKTVTLAETTIKYLENLAAAGTHGSDVTGVARTLIESGIRRAIKDGFIRSTLDKDNFNK